MAQDPDEERRRALTDLSLSRTSIEIDARRLHAVLLGALCLVVLVAFVPTGLTLARGPWQTEQEGHGPFILAAAAWFAWGKRDELKAAIFRPAPAPAWIILAIGLVFMFIGRSQEILAVEVFALLPLFAGVVLMVGGWRVLRILAFPIGLLFFVVPPPGWVIDALTLPLKASISDWVTRLLYRLGYPIAQNGVVIMIGPYQLLVKDACAGMNSIFALSAIGVIYLYIMQYTSKLRNILLLLAILPITVLANFVRVITLVLIAYHYGTAAVEGAIHDFTGLALFVVAFVLLVAFDAVLAIFFAAARRFTRPAARTAASP